MNGGAMKRTMLVTLALGLALSGCSVGGEVDPSRPAASSPVPSGSRSSASPRVEALPVWYDAAGLHHGDKVERTGVPLRPHWSSDRSRLPHLALVRTGAVYADPRTDDVWFHPWGGRPRVIGHGAASGPGGDPQGDIAVWFDGWHLMVYDTARHRVVSRTREVAGVEAGSDSVEHVMHSNGFVHVSAHEVVWRSPDGLGRRDLDTGTSVLPWQPRPPAAAVAIHARNVNYGQVDSHGVPPLLDKSAVNAVWLAAVPVKGRDGEFRPRMFVQGPGTAQTPLRGLDFPGRLSPDGRWLLTAATADDRPGVAITDVRTGARWKPFAKSVYAFFSWTYGDVAVMRIHRETDPDLSWQLVACHAGRRTCEPLRSRGDVLLPNP